MVYGRTSGAIRQVVRVFREGTLSGLSDREVLGRFVDDRDEAAFEALLTRHGPMVLNVCRQILRNPEDAEDAFQATFLALACKAGTLRIDESLGPWLYRVASRVAARARSERRRRADRERSGGPIPEPELDRGDRSDGDEILRAVHEELNRLPERLRAPIVLCYLEGMTHERAARQLGCPVGTVRSRLARARSRLHGRIARRGLVTTTAGLGIVLTTDAGASVVPLHLPTSLVKNAAQLAAGTASLRSGCEVSARVAALLEGVLNVLKVKQIAGSMAALTVIGVVATVAGLSTFSASGQTGDDEVRAASDRTRSLSRVPETIAPETVVKTYYIGDLIVAETAIGRARSSNQAGPGRGDVRSVDMSPMIDLITSTVARGTWVVRDGNGNVVASNGKPVKPGTAVPRSEREKVGSITPFQLSISLIIRHTKEGHDEVANLLMKLRRFVYFRDNPGGPDPDKAMEALGITAPADDRKPVPPTLTPPPDRNARIRRLLDELRQEVEALSGDRG